MRPRRPRVPIFGEGTGSRVRAMPHRGRCLALLVLWVLAAVWMPGAGTLVAHATVGVALQTSTYLYDCQVRHENGGDSRRTTGI